MSESGLPEPRETEHDRQKQETADRLKRRMELHDKIMPPKAYGEETARERGLMDKLDEKEPIGKILDSRVLGVEKLKTKKLSDPLNPTRVRLGEKEL